MIGQPNGIDSKDNANQASQRDGYNYVITSYDEGQSIQEEMMEEDTKVKEEEKSPGGKENEDNRAADRYKFRRRHRRAALSVLAGFQPGQDMSKEVSKILNLP